MGEGDLRGIRVRRWWWIWSEYIVRSSQRINKKILKGLYSKDGTQVLWEIPKWFRTVCSITKLPWKYYLKIEHYSWAWQHMRIISILRKLRQEDWKSVVILGYIEPHSNTLSQKKWRKIKHITNNKYLRVWILFTKYILHTKHEWWKVKEKNGSYSV